MVDENRPNPEQLLNAVMREESQRGKGKLKIFLGMAAGVGKTYAMLEAAQNLKVEGVDIAVGVVDTHGRKETARLLEGLEIIPGKQIKYRDAVFEELDLDAVLKRKPAIILIDELAHSNIPGARHPKRWQDVIEILDHGINVYTTLNVQHIESLKDVVEGIADIVIRETVPDIVIDTATSIELVDLTPEELRQRLKEGKVYLGGQSIIAADHFFQEDRLTALREIVMRYAAEKVDHDLKGMYSSTLRFDSWKPRERLLVAVSHSPHSQKLIRITRRLAFNLDAPWIALHVDNGITLNDEDKEMLAKNIALARDLGAEIIMTTGTDIAEGIQKIVRQKSITQIVIGRPPKRGFFDIFQRNTLVDRLARECSDIDLHVIRQTLFSKRKRRGLFNFLQRSSAFSYFFVLALMLVQTAVYWYFFPRENYPAINFYLLSIFFLCIFFRQGPIFFASILFAIIWLSLYLPWQSESSGWEEGLGHLGFYFAAAIVAGVITDRTKRSKELLVKRERSLETLYDIVQEFTTVSSISDAFMVVQEKLNIILGGKCEIIYKHIEGRLIFDDSCSFSQNEKEKAAAQWVYQNGKEAGWSTSTLPFAQNFYLPMHGRKSIVGVFAYHPKGNKSLTIDEKSFLYPVVQQLTYYVEHMLSEEKSKLIEQSKQAERIYESILKLVSNLFEGPLLNIQDAIKELKKVEPYIAATNPILHQIENIEQSSESLNRILNNIMAMVNLSAGLTPVNAKKQDLTEVIQNSCTKLKLNFSSFNWIIFIEEQLPGIYFDKELIELLFYNMIFHTIEFSIPHSQIKIEVKQIEEFLSFSCASEGQNIPEELIETVFEKFYRQQDKVAQSGLGLGIAIAKAIAEVHHGKLVVKNIPTGGVVFTAFLPIR